MENKEPRTFQDVRVFAGDNFYPAADANYRNLVWENIGLSGVVKKNTEIGTIPSWGPQFRVSFEMMIKSFVGGKWANVLSFKGNGATSNCCKPGDRVPAVFIKTNRNKKKYLVFSNSINGNGKYSYKYENVKLNKWYKITIEQIMENGTVRIVVLENKYVNKLFLTDLFHCHN